MSDLQAFRAATVNAAFEADPFAAQTIPAPALDVEEVEDNDPTLVMPARELAELRKIATPATISRPGTPPKPFTTLRDCPAAKAAVKMVLKLEGL